jgi:deaminated glutathione amidase
MSLPPQPLRVGVVQLTSTDSVENNIKMIFKELKRLEKQKPQLVCLPENCLFVRVKPGTFAGFSFDLSEELWSGFQHWAQAHQCELLFGSIPYRHGGHTYNATVHVSLRGVQAVYSKIHLFDVDVKGAPAQRESQFFTHGSKPHILDVRGWRVGLTICYDIRFSELFLQYAKEKVHLILIPAAFLVPTGKAHWHILNRARAIECQAFVVAAAQAGTHRSTVEKGARRETYGHTLAVDPWGRILKEVKPRKPGSFIVELDPNVLSIVREQIPMAGHRRL